jgi:spermidine synthase
MNAFSKNNTSRIRGHSYIKTYSVGLGASAMTIQVVFIRQFMSVFYGNELCIGLILSAWMLWVALGSWLGNWLNKRGVIRPGSMTYFLLFLLTFLSSFFGVLAVKGVRLFLHIPYGEFIALSDIIVFSALVLALPCLCLGLQFSILAWNAKARHVSGDPAAHIYVFESFGSMLAGLFLTFVIIRWLSHLQIILILMFFVLIMLFLAGRQFRMLVPAAVSAVLLFSPAMDSVEKQVQNTYWNSFGPGMNLVETDFSKYGEISIINWAGDKILYQNGLKQSPLPDPLESEKLAALVLSQHHDPQRVLLIGGGLGGLATAMMDFPVQSLTYTEIDERAFNIVMSGLAETERKKWQNKKLNVLFTDGRLFLRNTDSSFDIIVVNMGRPISVAVNKYYTSEFFRIAAKKLSPAGFLAICNFPSSAEYLADDLLRLNTGLYNSLRSAFDNVFVLPGESALYMASNTENAFTSNPEILAIRYSQWDVHLDYFFPQMFSQFYLPERLQYVSAALAGCDYKRINTDFWPTSYYFDFLIWTKLVRGDVSMIRPLSKVEARDIYFILIFLALLAAASIFFRGRKDRLSKMILLFMTNYFGFAAIGLDIILLLSFQTIFGNIYEWLGLVLAVFMAGLAVGGLFINAQLGKISLKFALTILTAAVVLLCLSLPLLLQLLSWSQSRMLFLVLVFVASSIIGMLFPLLCRGYGMLIKMDRLGSVYAADLIGGAIGSLLVAGLLVPLFGMVNTLFFTAIGGGIVLLLLRVLLFDPAE